MFAIRTEWTDIAWRIMHQTVANHFILPFEPSATLGSRATLDRTVMWPVLRVDIRMRAGFVVSTCASFGES